MSIEAKTCSSCKIEKPLSGFYKQKINQCKACRSAVIAKWREANKEKVLEQMRKTNRDWYEKNKQRAKEKQSAYAKNNKAKVNARAAQRRAALKQRTPQWADMEQIKMWYEAAEVLSRSGVEFHVDHCVPLMGRTVSGLHTHDNMQILPWYLNVKKNAKFEGEQSWN